MGYRWLGILGLVAGLVVRPLRAQVDSTPSEPARIPVDRIAVPNLTEALGGRFAGATMLRADGLSSTGGVLRMWGWRSLIFSNEPALEIDGVLVPVQPAPGLSVTTNQTWLPVVSLLDLLDPDEIDRIEVEPGLGAGVGRGAGLVNGLVRVTTTRGGSTTRFSAGSEWGVSSTPLDFDLPSYITTAISGGGAFGCPLAAQALRQCEPDRLLHRNGATDPLVRQTGTGVHGRLRLGVRGTAGRVRYAASGRWSSGYGALDLPPGERARLEAAIGEPSARLARPDRLGELFGRAAVALDLGKGLSISVAGNAARQQALTPASSRMPPAGGMILLNHVTDPRYPDSAAWVVGAPFSPADYYRRTSDRELLRRIVSADVAWEPNRRFRSWLRIAGVWDRHTQYQTIPDTIPFQGQQRLSFDSLSYREGQFQLELGLSQAVDLGPVRLTVAPAYQMRDRRPIRSFGQGAMLMEDPYRLTGGLLRTEITSKSGRVGLGGVVRRDEARRQERWETPTWAYSLRGWWTGLVSGHAAFGVVTRRPDVDGQPFLLGIVPGAVTLDLAPERMQELEIGLRGRDPGGRWEIGAVGFAQRTTDGWGTRTAPPSGGMVPVVDNVGAEIANTGLEVDAAAWLARGSMWRARIGVVATLLSSTLESNGEGMPSVATGICSFEGHRPFAHCGQPMPNVADLDGDGLLSLAEYEAAGPTEWGPRGAFMPTRTAGIWFDVTRAFRFGRVAILGHFDYMGGHWSEGFMAWAQCIYRVCREAHDPSSSIQEQAAAFAMLGTYFLRDASFGRMRELAPSWQTSGPLARWLSAEQVSLSVTARNVFTISGFKYWDPEIRQRAHEYAPFDQEAIPLPRTFTVKFAVDW